MLTESAGQAALRRGATNALAPDEERALRMRLGASPSRSAPLEQLAVADDARIDVMALELEAFLRLRARGEGARDRAPRSPASATSRTKEKIVRALRKKR